MSAKSNFIPHIAGLRGLAVLLVVAQHFGVPGFDAGFIGVDIFFVISGFLITGILLDEYSKSRDPESRIGGISLKAFYLRRARRILPAATVVTIAIVVFSWIVNNSSRFSVVLSDAIWSTFFSANINFAMKSTDYFQIGATPSPFQHFWSLSVEEQFYFIWPALILAALAFRGLRFRGKLVSWQNRLFFLFAVTTLASITLMVVSFYFEPSLSYFLTVSRAWELSLGAVAAIFIRSEKGLHFQNRAKYLAYLPVPLLIISFLLVRSNNFAYTLPLVVIASAIFVAKPADTKDWDARALSGKVPRFFGNISYSLYLWHWPVLTFGTELGFGETFTDKALLFALAIGMSTLSYYIVELKFQKISIPKFYIDNSVPPSKAAWVRAATALVIAVVVVPSVAVQPGSQSFVANLMPNVQKDGAPAPIQSPSNSSEPTLAPTGSDWLSTRQSEIATSNKQIAERGYLTEKQKSEIGRVISSPTWGPSFGWTCSRWGDCTLGNPSSRTKILAVGSSYTEMYMSTYSEMVKSGESIFVQMFLAQSCPNILSDSLVKELRPKNLIEPCLNVHKWFSEHVRNHQGFYDYVVLGHARFVGSETLKSTVEFANLAKTAASKAVILGQPPTNDKLNVCLNRDYSNYSKCPNTRQSSNAEYTVAAMASVAFGDISDLFCLDSVCPLVVFDAPTSASSHLTDVSAASIAPYFLDFLRSSSVPKI
jgi:peptidoglycan/LPS O-acetylase OafA/YrhL